MRCVELATDTRLCQRWYKPYIASLLIAQRHGDDASGPPFFLIPAGLPFLPSPTLFSLPSHHIPTGWTEVLMFMSPYGWGQYGVAFALGLSIVGAAWGIWTTGKGRK